MLFRAAVLEEIARGRVTLAFRRWRRPTVRAGGTLRTPVGVLAILAVDPVDEASLDDGEARRAGYASRAALVASLGDRPGTLYRVRLRRAGEDPRLALRERPATGAEAEELRDRLARLDRASRAGPWTRATLALVRDHPGRRAAELAALAGRETAAFKRDVRKLKDLGLTVSLETGYELSPRGRAWLRRRR